MLFLLLKGGGKTKPQELLLNKALVALQVFVMMLLGRQRWPAWVKRFPKMYCRLIMSIFGGSRTGSADVAKMMRYFTDESSISR